jgi:hypothetical protein
MSISAGRSDGTDPAVDAHASSEEIVGTDRAEVAALIILMLVCVGLPLISGIVRGHPVLGVANAVLLGLVGWGLYLLLQMCVFQPASIARACRFADRLSATTRSEAPDEAMHRSWIEGSPGAITVGGDGRIWLADRSTGFESLTFARADVAHAETVLLHHAPPHAGRGLGIGVGVPLGGGFVLGMVPGGRPRPQSARYGVALRYRAPADVVRSTLIPFGPDLTAAASMTRMLTAAGDIQRTQFSQV